MNTQKTRVKLPLGATWSPDFETKENKKLVERLSAHGLTMKQGKRAAAGPPPLDGKTIVTSPDPISASSPG